MMGGRKKVLEEAFSVYQADDFQWAAELATLLIRMDKKDMEARQLKAAAFRHLGYDQININWRNWYLTSAKELDGSLDITKAHLLPGQNFAAPDVVSALPARINIEGLTIRLKAEETYDLQMVLGFEFSGKDECYALEIRRGIAQFHETLPQGEYTVLEIEKGYLSQNPLNPGNLRKGRKQGMIGVRGDWEAVEAFFSYFDFEPHPLWLTVR
jgi:alkyl sulfatase BDS1-like metallo-beta-lactamase superfamily hydrolase